ncbi:GNAT family N-acetyltransferase [Streptomyces sp. NPDC002187]|uniref:GNAT family N-acetyltransferase n=1 Tax=Streptomyces sp. NPDC002187 TaxID=3364637 RepID=UPI00368D1E98
MAVTVKQVGADETQLIDAIVALGDQNTKTLGLLTPPVYLQAAERRTLLAAFEDDELVGYALYALPKRKHHHVQLTHLCVNESHRKRGIARRLVEEITARHRDRFGIRAKCRRDYELSRMWSSLGFVPRGEAPGRGSKGMPLDGWWRDHEHPDLFDVADSGALLTVAMDHGVFAELRALAPTQGTNESQSIEAPWLADLIELTVTPHLFHEVNKIKEQRERQHQRSALQTFRHLRPSGEAVLRRMQELTEATQSWEVPARADEISLLQYVAEAACAGSNVLTTRAPVPTRLADLAWDIAKIRVLPPAVVAMHVEELRQAQQYRPADLMGTAFRTSTVTYGGEAELAAFFDQPDTDRGSAFADRLSSLASDQLECRRELVRDADGHPVALYAWAREGDVLVVPIFRTATHPLEETLARQLLFLLKGLCRDHGGRVLKITDKHVSPSAQAAAADDGFVQDNEGLVALVVDVCGAAETVRAHAAEAASLAGRDIPALGPGLPATVASSAEVAWWPAKITDALLPSFLVPIEPRWSSSLFNVPPTLLPRGDVLGMSREHVYYRSPGHRGERVPARLLWYMSEGVSGQQAVGCSRLDEVVVDDADALFERFEHLGVYGRNEVRDVADKKTGLAMALRFSDTEIFPHRVSLRRMRQLSRSLDVPLPLISLSEISNELFRAVYQEGHSRT